jgi:chemotaxis methyl-accepting protein methylase
MSVALREIARIVKHESGIELGPSQLPSLQAAISRVDSSLTAEALLDQALSAKTLERLIDEVTVRETFFFRHRSEFEAIDWRALLEGARARGSDAVRVWIAACASGEEAYTVAILACEAFASASPPVRVLGTDIAPTALLQARRGRYGQRAVRTVPSGARERYFSSKHGLITVGESLRALVEFRQHNLVRDLCPPGGFPPFDVILCRNVLIYFDRPTVEHVLGALERSLAAGGLLLLGAADRLSRQSLPVPRLQGAGVGMRSDARARAPLRGALQRPVKHDPVGGHPKRARAVIAKPQRASRDFSPTPAEAMRAADRGELELAVAIAGEVLAEDPLDCQAHFIRGVAELARENARAAVEPLRRALYIDPNFGLAAFKLACAHDALAEVQPARRAYERTLRTLDHCAADQAMGSDQSDLLDIAGACHARLRAISGQPR